MQIRIALATCVLASLAAAQTPAIFSPAAAATGLGNSNNNIPFSWTPSTYQQVHSQNSFSSTSAAVINRLSFRMASGFTNRPGHMIDVELFMAQSPNDAANASTTFASNITAASEVNVYTRKMFSLPTVPDNSWAISFPFDNTFPYTGITHVSWRANVYGNSNNNAIFTYPIDAFSAAGVSTLVGVGCRSANGTANATHTVSGLVIGTTASFTGNSFVPAGGLPAILTIGVSNTSFGSVPLPLDLGPYGAPGCSIYNDWVITLFGTTMANASGSVVIQVPIPNDQSLVNSVHYSQYLFAEQGANALGIFTSNGRANTIAAPPGVTRVYSTAGPGQTTGTRGLQFGLAIGLN
jgi:hypothetical protein